MRSAAALLCLASIASAHFTLQDTAKNYEVTVHAAIKDTAAITNFSNAPTHYDNSGTVQISVDGHFTEAFQFGAQVNIFTEHTNREIADHFYNPNEGIPYNKQSENKRTRDMFSAHASYELQPVTLLGGFDYIQWGPARRNHVILRGNQNNYRPWQDSSSRITDPAPTPYFGYQFEIGPVVYSQYAMKLFEKKNAGKYLHAHRLDLNLPASIKLGISETSLYGTTTEAAGTNPNLDADSTGREFEWAYVIPFIPYVFEEHIQGDQDNISLAFDISVKTIPHWEFYGELLWDDMKSPTSMLDDSWWGNKWAASVGVARDSLRLGNTFWSWYTEYTRVEPWVYTHHKGGAYTYASYAQSMGSDLGPNSQELYAQLKGEYTFTGGVFDGGVLSGTLHASAVAQDSAFGGKITDIHTPESAIDKKFLAEETTLRYYELGGQIEFQPWCWMSVRAGYTRFFGDYEGFRATAAGSFQW